MTFQPINAVTSYVPTSFILPEDPQDLVRVLNDLLTKIIAALNDKEIGHYNTVELLNGQQFFTNGNPGKFRQVFRTVIDCGALPDNSTNSVAHNIAVDANTVFTRIYGVATNPNTSFIPLPYINIGTPGNSVQLDVNATNVNITTSTASYTGYSKSYVILEYVKTI